MKKDMTLEQAMKKLEEINDKMMDSNLPIDKSLKLFEEGLELVKFCEGKLNEAQLKITQLKNEVETEDE